MILHSVGQHQAGKTICQPDEGGFSMLSSRTGRSFHVHSYPEITNSYGRRRMIFKRKLLGCAQLSNRTGYFLNGRRSSLMIIPPLIAENRNQVIYTNAIAKSYYFIQIGLKS